MLAGLKISCIFIPATLYQLCDILLFFLSPYRFFNLVTYHLFRVFPLCTFPSLVRYSMNTIKPTTSLSYLNATGQIPYGMTNDYMFRIILEKNNYVLKGLICSLLSLKPEEVVSVEIQNPILLNEAVDDKEFILDIKVLLNNSAVINLEMQMAYQLNWKERSLSYLCRVFDQLSHGHLYGNIKPAIHIGFLNFDPVSSEHPEFYSSYRLLNEKTYTPYSDKFILRVVNLRQIDSATDEDRANRIDYWARLFTTTTWEEIKMLAKNNEFIASASQSLYESNADEITREKCRARENYICLERTLAEQEKRLAEQEAELTNKTAALAEQKAALADKDKIIEKLKKQLAEIQSAE